MSEYANAKTNVDEYACSSKRLLFDVLAHFESYTCS